MRGMNEIFRALADPTRRAILQELNGGPRSAGALAELFPIAKSTLSGHFNVLKAADLVHQEKQGTSVVYHLNSSVVAEVASYLLDWFGIGAGTATEGGESEAGGAAGTKGSTT